MDAPSLNGSGPLGLRGLLALRDTDCPERIEEAVYRGRYEERRVVLVNPNLTPDQCEFLLGLLGEEFDRVLLVENPACPVSLLEKIAYTDPSPLVRGVIARNTAVCDQARAAAGLRGVVSEQGLLEAYERATH